MMSRHWPEQLSLCWAMRKPAPNWPPPLVRRPLNLRPAPWENATLSASGHCSGRRSSPECTNHAPRLSEREVRHAAPHPSGGHGNCFRKADALPARSEKRLQGTVHPIIAVVRVEANRKNAKGHPAGPPQLLGHEDESVPLERIQSSSVAHAAEAAVHQSLERCGIERVNRSHPDVR